MTLYYVTTEKPMLIVYEIEAESATEAKNLWEAGDRDYYEMVDCDSTEKFLSVEEAP